MGLLVRRGLGAATAATTTLVAPGTPAASQTNGTVTVTWTAATAPGAGTVSYFVERRVQPGTTFVNACGTTSTARVTSLTCAETPGAGTYVWRVTAYFSSWTATSAESAALVVPNPDTTPPTGNVTAPSAAANVRGTVSVTSNSADSGSGVASAQFQRSPNGANTWTTIGAADTTSPYSVSWDTTTVLDGLYDLRVITTDNVGNAFTSPVVAGVRVDNTAPSLSLALSSPTNASITATTVYFRSSVAGSFTFVATVTDTGSGTASATFPLLTATNWTTHAAQTVSTPAGGPYSSTAFSWSAGASTPSTYTITATDAAGNTTSTPITFSPDTTAPTGAVTSPAASAAVRATITVTSDSADAASGVASALFQRSPAGTNTWTNIAAADTTAPYSASFVTTGVTDGLYDLRVTTTDNVGNTFTSALTTNVRVDNTAPTGAITAPAAAAKVKGTVSITSSSADTGSGVATAQFQSSPAGAGTWSNIGAADTVSPYATSWDTTTYADGLYDLRVITTDVAGNTFTSATIANVLVDNTAPTGAITAPASSANVKGTVTVTANSADAGSGVANAQFQTSPAGTNTWTNLGAADTTSPYSASWVTTTGFPDGLYDLRVITTDTVGITFTSPTTTNVRVDNTAPTISVALASGPTGAFLNGNVVFFKANAAGNFQFVATVTDGGSGAASATFPALSATNWTTHNAETDTTPPGGPFSSSTFSWVATGAAPASYTITGTDAAGNTVTRAITFTVDSTAPTGAVTAPAAAANIRGTVSVTSNSADAGSGVASAQFQTSPAGAGTWSNLGAADTVTPYATSWDTTTFTDGLYDVRVITTDNVGNTFTSATIANVRVDNTAPTGAVTAPVSSANVKGTFTVTANSADAGSGVANAQFQTSPAGTNTWSNLGAADTTSPYSVSWVTTTGFPDGLYDLRVVTTDKSGNTFTSATTTNVRVDNTAPTISVALASGPTGAFLNGTVVFVQVERRGELQVRRHRDRRRLGRGVGDVPGPERDQLDHPRHRDADHARGRAVHLDHVQLGRHRGRARVVHHHRHRRRRQHRHAGDHVHRRHHRTDGSGDGPGRVEQRERHGERHVELGRRGQRCRERAVPAVTCRRGHVDRHRHRHDVAVHDHVGHDDGGRRALRPARDHDRQCREHVHVGDDHQRAGRQHRTHRIGHRTLDEHVRERLVGRGLGARLPTRAAVCSTRSSRRRPRVRAPGATSAPPTPRRPTASPGTPRPSPTAATTCASSSPTRPGTRPRAPPSWSRCRTRPRRRPRSNSSTAAAPPAGWSRATPSSSPTPRPCGCRRCARRGAATSPIRRSRPRVT